MRGFLYTFIVIVMLVLITTFVYNNVEAPAHEDNATTTPSEIPAHSTEVTVASNGEFTMKLYERANVQGTTIHVWAVTEDSRCAVDVQCIWAGRVKVATYIGTAMGTSTNEFEVGSSITTENKKITLVSVLPEQKVGHKITDDEYRFVFKIENHNSGAVIPSTPGSLPPAPPASQGKCYVGGCSSQLCSDQPNMVSTCEWRAAYVCYNTTSTCERQADGRCGWTQNPELEKCLREAN